MSKYYIGTSGFSYASWKNVFYPDKLPSSKWLEYYSSQFNSLELNNTFYRFPVKKNMEGFYSKTPGDFIFSVKVHKIITHTLRMKNAKEKIDEFLAITEEGLREKLGCILYQFPPSFKYSEENLENILQNIPNKSSSVVEFRHESWWNDEIVEAFRKHHLTFCNVSYPDLPEDCYSSSDRFYLRMHGVPELFKSAYNLKELKLKVAKFPHQGNVKAFIYFNNTMFEAGFTNAFQMQKLLMV